nr:MAG: hypothetical protein A2V48_02265 [Candidatus Amesbacteria bacterium RBG_19FT_COMBO_48_16]
MEKLVHNIYRRSNRPVIINGHVYSPYESRSKFQYDFSLFPENPIEVLGAFGYSYMSLGMVSLGLTYPTEFTHYKPGSVYGDLPSTISASEIRQELGAQKGMFFPGSRVLDLGNGAGRAKHQYQRLHRRSTVIGIDLHNSEQYPAYPHEPNFVGAGWSKLPFADNSFTGILACETFPRHVGTFNGLVSTVNEITRISKPGAIYRATTSFNDQITTDTDADNNETQVHTRIAVIQELVSRGWEVFATHRLIISRLLNKKD